QKHQPELFHLFSPPVLVVTLRTKISYCERLRPLVAKLCGNNLLRCPKFTASLWILHMPASKTGQPVLSFSNKNRGALLEKAPRRFRFGVGQKKTFTANSATRGSAAWPARNVPEAALPFGLSMALIRLVRVA